MIQSIFKGRDILLDRHINILTAIQELVVFNRLGLFWRQDFGVITVVEIERKHLVK